MPIAPVSRVLLGLLAGLATAAASADLTLVRQQSPVINVWPETGGYFYPSQPGTGLMLEVAQNGLSFGAFFYYDAIGRSKWATLQGPCTPSSEHERMTSGVLCRISQPSMYEFKDGPCWGCPWRQNVLFNSTDLGSQVEVVFFSQTSGELRASGQILPLTRLAEAGPGLTRSQQLSGFWRRTRYRIAQACNTCGFTPVRQDVGTIQIAPATEQVRFLRTQTLVPSMTTIPFPSDDVPQYELRCIDDAGAPSGCEGLVEEGRIATNQLIYEEPGSRLLRLIVICTNSSIPNCETIEGPVGNVIRRNAISGRSDIYLSGNRIVLRGTTLESNRFVIQREEVWEKLSELAAVPIGVPWPF